MSSKYLKITKQVKKAAPAEPTAQPIKATFLEKERFMPPRPQLLSCPIISKISKLGAFWVSNCAAAPSPLDIFAVRDFQDQHRDPFILDIANQTEIANPIPPKSAFVTMEGLAPLSWILRGLEPLTEKTNDGLLSWTVEFLDLPFSGPGNLNRPDQACAPVLRA